MTTAILAVSGIYRLLNTVNGKCYVGQAINLRKRAGEHTAKLERLQHRNRKLHNSVNKHGANSFVFEVCHLCDPADLTRCEQWYCDALDSVKNGYNIRVCVESNAGVTPELSDEVLAAKSARAKAMQSGPEFKAQLSARMKSRHADPEYKAANSARMKALHADPEFKKKLLSAINAMNADPEIKAAQSARMKARHADPEFKAALSARAKALQADPEFKAANAARIKAMNSDQEVKANFIAQTMALNADPVFIAKRSSAVKAMQAARTPEQRAASGVKQSATIARKRASKLLIVLSE